MDLRLQLLDALDQLATDGTLNATTAMALVTASLLDEDAAGAPPYANRTASPSPSPSCPAELLGPTSAFAFQGVATLRSLRLRALKGEYQLQLSVVSTRSLGGDVDPLSVRVTVPPCRVGQVPQDGGYLCDDCGPLTFSLWQDEEPLVGCAYPSAVDCQPCPLNAECPGGAVLVPAQGAWHSAANSSNAILCPNGEACRADDDEAQEALISCQQWWYGRPVGFNYSAFAESILANDSRPFPEAPGALPDGGYNASDPALCALWGLPADHPAAYMAKQCGEGYGGNLCATCTTVDGVSYATDGDFGCSPCYSRAASIAISAVSFAANVLASASTVLLTFIADYTEEEEMAVGDMVKVIIVHFQYFVIILRLNIEWPNPLVRLGNAFGALTGSFVQVYSPSCWLGLGATPAQKAAADVSYALISPLAVIATSVLCWLARYLLWNGAKRVPVQAALEIFGCYFLDTGEGPWPEFQQAAWRRGYWTRNMNQECYSGEHARLWVPIGAVCIVVVCIGIPLASFLIMFVNRQTLQSVDVVQTYGFLYRRYNDGLYYWQSITQVQTLLLVVVDVFGRVLPVYQKAVLLQMMLVLTMSMNAFMEPSKFPRLEALEFVSLAVLSLTISLGLFFVPQLGHVNPVGQSARTAIMVLIMAINLAAVLYMVYVIVQESRDDIAERLGAADQGVRRARSVVRRRVAALGRRLAEAGRRRRRREAGGGGSRRGSGRLNEEKEEEEEEGEKEGQRHEGGEVQPAQAPASACPSEPPSRVSPLPSPLPSVTAAAASASIARASPSLSAHVSRLSYEQQQQQQQQQQQSREHSATSAASVRLQVGGRS
ncbi:hypothetical protein GPECTOR_161g128 [Gonium pectorale]|uniref:TRP C-terminal domain-containing protein n=1 Tax=Gonium pectorale TaxID=33097 RepID=A0A150FXJ8_GONPE|nr:hypothetical protein GPECTOR_161g128 [Gonium pectorale]|eukprot:KXZ42329.1 hypothetical protein GPECTOR_161g128 [Gonium pectorale]